MKHFVLNIPMQIILYQHIVLFVYGFWVKHTVVGNIRRMLKLTIMYCYKICAIVYSKGLSNLIFLFCLFNSDYLK